MRYLKPAFFVILFFFVVILFGMVVDVWNSLPKSQSDPETIEQAIARIVGEHDTDPDAHLGATGSLTAHRTNGVLDHLAGSIPADKFSAAEVIIRDQFLTLDSWTVDDGQATASGYMLILAKTSTNPTSAQVVNDVNSFNDQTIFGKDILMQFVHRTANAALHPIFYASFGAAYTGEENGFGVKIEADGATFYVAQNSVYTYTTKYLLDATQNHIYRVHVSALDGLIGFYVDGDLAATVPVTEQTINDFSMLTLRHVGDNGVYTISYVGDLIFAHDL